MSAPRPVLPRTLVAGGVLVLVGLLLWAVYALQTGRERHAYASGAAPAYVRLLAGHTYWIAIRDGVRRESALGVSPGALQCTATPPTGAGMSLQVSALPTDTKAVNQIASFTSTVTGSVHVECTGLGNVYVDNAADASFDVAGLCLVLAAIALAIGLPLAVSGLRSIPRPIQDDEDESLESTR